MKQYTIDMIEKNKVVAIVRGVDIKDISNVATALYEGGIRLIEVTFDQKDPDHLSKTHDIIKLLVQDFGDKMCIGAGTVINEAQCEAAYTAGAKYFISPNVSADVIKAANKMGVVSIPGALTPSEAVYAHDTGADFVKLFPAGNLGTGYIKSLCAPLNHIKFLAVGGVNSDNVLDFLSAGAVGVGVGGSLVDTKVISKGEFSKLSDVARQYINKLEGK